MKKLFILVISTITFIPYIFTMENTKITKEKALVCAPKNAEIPHLTINELNDKLRNCISTEFYAPDIMRELIAEGANPNIALFHVWRKIRTPKIPDITNIPITEIMNNPYQILNFNNNLKKQFKFLCQQQAFDQKTLIEIQSLKSIIKSMTNTLLKFDSLCPYFNNQKVVNETTIMKGMFIEHFLQSLADKLKKNQPLHNVEQDPS